MANTKCKHFWSETHQYGGNEVQRCLFCRALRRPPKRRATRESTTRGEG